MRWQGQREENVTFWENAWWNNLWQDFASPTWSCLEIHSLKDPWHLQQGLHDHWEGWAVILQLHKSFWGVASWGKGQNQSCSLLSHKSSPNLLQISAWVKDQRCIYSCMQQLCISVLGITPGYDEHWTQCSCFCLLWGRGTCYWEIGAVKLWLHSQRAYIFISVLVGVTWYLTRGNLKEGRSIVAHGWRGRSMMDIPSHNYGNSSRSLLCLYLLESRSKERARGQKLAGLYKPQGLPPSESLIPAGPPCSEDDTTSWKGTASGESIVRYEPVGGHFISNPTNKSLCSGGTSPFPSPCTLNSQEKTNTL